MAIKYTSCDTVLFNYIPFSKFHTLNGDDTIPRIPCQVAQVFQMQLSVIQFTIKMFHTGFMQVLTFIVVEISIVLNL